MGERVKRLALYGRIGFNSKSGETNEHSQLTWLMFSMKEQCGEQAGKFACCAVGKDT